MLRDERRPALNVSNPVRRQLALVSKGPAIIHLLRGALP